MHMSLISFLEPRKGPDTLPIDQVPKSSSVCIIATTDLLSRQLSSTSRSQVAYLSIG